MHKKIQQFLTSLKEQTYVSYAKIASLGGLCDINIIVVKATSPDDLPLPDKYVHELLKIFSICPSSCQAFTLSLARRFRKTRAWRVALKCLLLLHRLLRALADPSYFRAELLWARTNGVLCLYPCNFRDSSSSASEEYTAFVNSYARFLDEALDCSASITAENEIHCLTSQVIEEGKIELKMQELGRMLEVLPQVQSLIDCVINCRPAGMVARSFLVHLAMKHITRDSFMCYTTFRREMVVVLENLIQLPYRSCAAAFGIYKKSAYQADRLSDFLEWSRAMGYCGSYEYPIVDRIPEIQIRALESFLIGMWELTDQSSSSNTESPASLILTDGDEGGGMEMGPLIEWEDNNASVGWEELLEASVKGDLGKVSITDWQCENDLDEVFYGGQNFNGFQTTNPFYQQQCRIILSHGSCPNTPIQSWGL